MGSRVFCRKKLAMVMTMALKIGIVGLPNVGKSTLFRALTKIAVPIAPYPFTTIEPHVGVVAVPDERLDTLAEVLKPERVVPAAIEFVDIAGLVKGAAEGQGLGNQFLSHIYTVDAVLFLLRSFQDSNVPQEVEHPKEELSILRAELQKKDDEVSGRTPASPRLSDKPSLIACNVRGDDPAAWTGCGLTIDCKLELEMSEMSPGELKELGMQSKLGELIQRAYEALGLITFYTIKGGQELHAWPIKRGAAAPDAGGVVHSDFQEKFIRAEVVPYPKLIEAGSWSHARELGWIRTEGRDYAVQDGDVIEFRI